MGAYSDDVADRGQRQAGKIQNHGKKLVFFRFAVRCLAGKLKAAVFTFIPLNACHETVFYKRTGTTFATMHMQLHNFYPREGTGLNVKKLQQQNELLHKYNISVGAFIPSYNKARSPIKKGLPTLEIHRYQTASLAMRHLKLLGIDSIFIGDSLPTEDEIQELANLTDEYILLKAKKLTQNKYILKTLQQSTFTARLDEADGAIRTQESRALFKQIYICPEYIAPREIGSITLDNALYARYAGEMQIITHAQKKDNKINTIAKLLDSELILLPYIKPNSKFKIKV